MSAFSSSSLVFRALVSYYWSSCFAILLGMLLALFYEHRDKTKEGISFTSKCILQTAVVLLGFGLNLTQVMAVGMQSLPIIISTIATALLVAYGSQKWLRLDVNTATLVGVGSSICGGLLLQRRLLSLRQRMMRLLRQFQSFFSLIC